jgi:hypothetical protein
MSGKITEIFTTNLNDPVSRDNFEDNFIRNGRKVFFCGLYSQSWGYIISIDSSIKKNMLKCYVDNHFGDSGGLLFFQDENDDDNLKALGILSCDNSKHEVFFSTFSECFDKELFELA